VKRSEFISHCHRGMTGGHRAFRSTLDQVSRRGFWIGWRRVVARFCRQCLSCSSYHRRRLHRTGHLQPMITGSIMERCYIDIAGPHPRTPRGSKYILTFVDAFSKWAEAFGIPNKEAKTVARVLIEQVFCRFGTPVALLSHNAGELDGRLMQEICRLLDIDKHRMKHTFCLVREHLGTTAERMKRRYDLRMRPQQFRRGQWVLYYNPRKFQGRQQKWQRKVSPHLIIRELPPVNYMIQKSKRSRPFIATLIS